MKLSSVVLCPSPNKRNFFFHGKINSFFSLHFILTFTISSLSIKVYNRLFYLRLYLYLSLYIHINFFHQGGPSRAFVACNTSYVKVVTKKGLGDRVTTKLFPELSNRYEESLTSELNVKCL